MAPHWDIGRRIYGRGQMLILNLRRCAVLHPLPHLLFAALSLLLPLSAVSYLFLSSCHCTMPFSTFTSSSVSPAALFQSLLTLLLCRLCTLWLGCWVILCVSTEEEGINANVGHIFLNSSKLYSLFHNYRFQCDDLSHPSLSPHCISSQQVAFFHHYWM